MGLVWNSSAIIATIVLILIGASIISKLKQNKDSIINKTINRFKYKKDDEENNEQIYYKKIINKGGVKW